MITRTLQKPIEKAFFSGKVIILYGARQVGKTTLIQALQKKNPTISRYLNCDEPHVREALTQKSSAQMKAFLGNKKLIFLDEAQRVPDIGLSLKLLVDTDPDLQIVATGSSSFELANSVVEPLTGRNITFYLHPLTLTELGIGDHEIATTEQLSQRMITGFYPAVVTQPKEHAADTLKQIAHDYLYKDILTYQDIRNPDVIEKLLQALALQIGSEVSYNELSRTLGIAQETVASYVRILEHAFIIFRLQPFHRNARTELRKLRKVYFWDIGMRNALINNMNPLDLRTDAGALWENVMIAERRKAFVQKTHMPRMYFWRTRAKQEIDYLEENDGILSPYEMKWSSQKRVAVPKAFRDAYPDAAEGQYITPTHFRDFIRS